MGSLAALLVVIGTVISPVSLGAVSADAPSPGLPPTGAGIDISFPQCTPSQQVELPTALPFTIVGINGGSANNDNPCLSSQYNGALLLAGDSEQPHAAVYVNTGDPALAGAWWPKSDTTQDGAPVSNPDGICAHTAGAACAYVYGYSMAKADYRRAKRRLSRIPKHWWLDVETTNTWQTDTNANAASLTGMVDYFQSKALTVGIYSTALQWSEIAGVTPATSHLAGLDSWLAGGTYASAPADCEKAPLTPGGFVAMIQFVTHLDNDYPCRHFPTASSTVQTPPQAIVGATVTATPGKWADQKVKFSYQWSRNGSPITGATSSTYALVADDRDANVTVTITGESLGYGTTSVTSAPLSALSELTPSPVALTGTATSGNTLTVTTGVWKPGTVAFSYAWYRDGTLVQSGPTDTTYVLSSEDVGHVITATVTGTETGYATVTESVMTAPIPS